MHRRISTNRYAPLVAFAAAVALLLMAGLAARNTSRRTVESSVAVDDSYALLLKLDDVRLVLAETISNTRGFLFTGLDVFVRPLDGYRQTLDSSLDDLERDLAQKPEQLARLAELRTLIERRLVLNDQYLRMRRENDVQGALDEIPAGGEQLVQQIRDQLAEIGSIEVALLDEQRTAEAAIARRAEATMTLAGIVSLIILAFTFLALGRQVRQREEVEDSLLAVENRLRQSQKMEAIGRLASGVAHDFNNLLTIIQGHCDRLLRRHADSTSVQKSAGAIVKAGARGASLTGQLLAFSRQQVLALENVDLNDVVRDLIAMVSRAGRDDIELVTRLADDLPAVRADRGQLDQVVLNLVVNAQDAMPSGGRLTLETAMETVASNTPSGRPGPPPGRYTRLTVRDTGIGMDSEAQSHIFEPFFTTKQDKGTGLGLATVYGIVTQLDGDITVESNIGAGTSFTVLLPRSNALEPDAPRAGPVLSSDATPRGHETVLVVEDEADVRALTVDWIREQGYAVLEAANGADALRVAVQHAKPIQALVTDIVMPRMNGRELYERLSRAQSDLKVLFVSGFADDTMHQGDPQTGDAAFLPNPLDRETLLHELRRVLG